MPADEPGAFIAEAESPRTASSPLLGIVIAVAALAAGGYWVFMRPAPAAREAARAQSREASAPSATPTAATASPEARAWDAAASAKEVPPPSPTAPQPASAPTPTTPPASIEEMVDRVMPAVVLIETTAGRGSGFFISRDTLITNVHVVQNDAYVTLRKNDGSTVNARVDSRSPAYDIAVLKVASPSPSQVVIPMATAQGLKPGQEIVVIGSALGTLQNSVSRGIVSGLRSAGGATLVQTDAAVNPGNSGGPMLDRNGAVIGITTMGYKGAEGLNFGVAIDHARDLVEGRQPGVGTQSGLTDIQSQSRGSESDRRQQQGEEQFRGAVGQLANTAREIDAGWARFRSQCYQTRITGSYDREWFAVMVPHSLPTDAAAGCVAYYHQLESAITEFHGLMQRTVAEARRSAVLPGTVRDVLREKKLDFDWDR
jgi:S1-C subfamily serine protease